MALLIVLGAVGLMLLAVWAWRSGGDARSLARHERAVTVLRSPLASATTVPVASTQPVMASPLVADAHGSAYTVQGRYAVTVSATGSCWLRVRQGESGPVVYEGTLQHGDTRRFESSAPLW